jgi:ABC-2 type transport system ATP-binding protein
MMPTTIRLEKLSKRFGAETALDQVSLEVPSGVVFALLGENGAGKTTAIRIMLGLLQPDAGRAEVLGRDAATDGLAIRQRVGYVAERPTLYDWMTIEEIGWFTAGFYGPEKGTGPICRNGPSAGTDAQRCSAHKSDQSPFPSEYVRLIGQFGLAGHWKKKLKRLSKGMRAKVALSLALAHQPELLVLDEPTSGLDVLVRREFLESMVDRAALGQTVFLSSHQIVEVERVADIVAILRRGKLLLVEPLDRLKASVRRLTVTLRDGQAAPTLPADVQILSQRQRSRQWQALVRGLDEPKLAALRACRSVEAAEVHSASLEDIFIAYMQPSARASPLPPAGEGQGARAAGTAAEFVARRGGPHPSPLPEGEGTKENSPLPPAGEGQGVRGRGDAGTGLPPDDKGEAQSHGEPDRGTAPRPSSPEGPQP